MAAHIPHAVAKSGNNVQSCALKDEAPPFSPSKVNMNSFFHKPLKITGDMSSPCALKHDARHENIPAVEKLFLGTFLNIILHPSFLAFMAKI
jgi:hypothetical protein